MERFHLLHESPARAGFEVAPGTLADYRALARFHYRARRPATLLRILSVRDRGHLAGVLVVSSPTLNGRWRDLAWPGRYGGPDKRAAARRLNAEVRTISRVIIDPRCRGLGLGAELVRAYLSEPLTPATEAIAAMGICCPFFERAGMVPIPLLPCRRDVLLSRRLCEHGIAATDLIRSAPRSPSVLAALRTWAGAARSTRPLATAPPETLGRAAAFALLARPVAYAHGRNELTPVPQAPLHAQEGPRCPHPRKPSERKLRRRQPP